MIAYALKPPSKENTWKADGSDNLIGESYWVEDCENGTLKANGTDGIPRTDRQPLVVAERDATIGVKPRNQDDHDTFVAYSITPESGQGADLRAVEVEETNALQAQNVDPGYDRGTRIASEHGVRRLTPVECERLQALPDGWTDLGGTPDSKRYAALGDAVTASVTWWIGRRLIAAIKEDGQ